jgi:hypothetical protein
MKYSIRNQGKNTCATNATRSLLANHRTKRGEERRGEERGRDREERAIKNKLIIQIPIIIIITITNNANNNHTDRQIKSLEMQSFSQKKESGAH